MREYTGRIFNKEMVWLRPDLIRKMCDKYDGYWYKVKLEILGVSEDPKTAEQLGYYWGLLLPEIHAQMQRDGHTITVTFGDFSREIPIPEFAAHEVITGLCCRIGSDGEAMRLSGIGLVKTILFIDNVLNFAGELRMDTEALKAKRPN